MTWRAVLLGLAGAALLAAVGYFNDQVILLTPIVGNHLPISVFGLLALIVLAVNPLLFALSRRAPLKRGELASIVAIMLVACSIPGAGLMWTFVPSLGMPAEFNLREPSWQRYQVMSYVPDTMLPLGGRYDREVTGGLVHPSRETDEFLIPVSEVPWQAWGPPMATWIPLILLTGLAGICIALIVHPQWSKRERLRYPIALFTRSLLDRDPGRAAPRVLYSRLFWLGFGVIFAIHLINGLYEWELTNFELPLTADVRPQFRQFPGLMQLPGVHRLLRFRLWITVAAFSFFLASDVAFSLGFSQLLYFLVLFVLMQIGVDTSSSRFVGGGFHWLHAGAYFGLALTMLYLGRRHYGQVVWHGLGLGRGRCEAEGYSVWAFRALAVVMAALVGFLSVRVGLSIPLALGIMLVMLLMFLVLARIVAETGLFWIQPGWQPLIVLLGLFGTQALGPENFISLAMLCVVLSIDPRESLLPFVVTGLKISDDAKVRPSRTGVAAVGSLTLALAVATPLALWVAYSYGLLSTPWQWAGRIVPQLPFNALVLQMQELASAGTLGDSASYSLAERFAHARVDWSGFGAWGGVGLLLVLACGAMRLRLTWWPLHPVLFLIWGTHPISFFWASFLLGWMVKEVVTRMGTVGALQKARQVAVGAIAADLTAGLAFMAAGAIYYALTHQDPPDYRVFP